MLSTLRSQRGPFSVLGSSSFMFSTTAEVQTEYYNRFKKNYNSHLQSFKSKLNKLEEENQEALKKPFGKAYSHPYHSEHRPIAISTVKLSQLFSEAVGPEQVSPHYENFLMSRKYTITFIVGMFALTYLSSIADLNWVLRSTVTPWGYWFLIMWFTMEGRKSMLKPLLNRWYARITSNEVYNFEVYYTENIEFKVRELMEQARSQMEYTYIHSGYKEVKSEVTSTFLIQEYGNLQKHIHDRAVTVLKTAQQYEQINRDAIFQEVLTKTLKDLDEGLKGEKGKEVRRRILESAIEGLAEGKMEYKNDPVLPLVEQSIQKNVQFLVSKTPKEQAEMVSLNADQLKAIRDADQTAKDHFLHAEPSIDGSIKNMERVKQLLQAWGK